MTSPLEFWVGTWDVHDSATGARAGWNEITSILDGRAVLERWRGVSGLEGTSLFWDDGASGTWRQVWATSIGWAKQKTMVASGAPGAVRFEGIVALPGGTTVRDRTTLTPLGDGSVRQVIEAAPFDGDWEIGFDAVYTPALSPIRASDSGS